ncbi:hypothetical protein C7W93_02845 [Glaciimonas sp. PCH181]|nr:hypothetical protein C7W93_02845 [Glaciimonas sp. PCH181]
MICVFGLPASLGCHSQANKKQSFFANATNSIPDAVSIFLAWAFPADGYIMIVALNFINKICFYI